MGNKQGHELSPEEKQRLKEEKRLLKEDKEHKKRLRKIEQRRLKDEKRKGTGGSSSAAATPATVKKDTEDAQSVGGSSVWSEKSVGSAPESWYHSASEPGSKRSSIYLPASAGPGYYQHDCWYSGYEDSGSEKSKPSSRAGSRPGSRPPSRAPSVKDTLNLRSSSLERYPLGVPTGEAIEPMHKAGSLDLANVVATNFLENREQLAGELEIAAAIASRYDETIRASKEQLEKTSVDKASLIDRASLTDKISLTSSIYHSAEEGSTRGEKRKVHLEDRESLSSVYYSADEASIGSKRKVFDYGSDHTSATGSIYYSADEGGSVAGSVYYTATSGSEVEDHVTDAEILGKDRPSPPSKPVAVDREGSALSRLAYIKVENDALLLHWEAPESDGGTPISGYILERCEGDGDFWVRVNLVPIKDTEYAVANLIGGREYRFRVSAENAVGVSDPSERSEMVSISTDQEATEPHFLKELRDVTAVEGHRVEFIVDIIGTPPPDVSWYKDGFEIFDTKRFEFVADGDRYSLVLKEAKISDAGDIRVRATNRVGVASSQAVLHIQAPPRITLPPQYEQGLIFDTDELIRLRVPYTGRPPPLATWAHNGKEIEVDDRHTMDVSEKYITLKIAGANRADKGMYSLNLANPQGIDNVSFFVTVTDRPDPPSMPVVTDITGQSVTLRWDPPQDDGGCRISNYIVEYFRMGWDVWLKGASSRITWTQLSELIVGSEYRFRVKAENAYGVSDPGEECEPVLIDETKSPSGSFDFETYKSTTAVGSSLPRDSATLIKEEGSSFEYGSSDIGSEGATDSVEKAKLQGMGASDEVESSLDLGSSSEKGHSLDYGGSMERGASYELGASMERGASYELGASMERGASYELGASMERGDSYELGASMERGASYELGASMERGASYELGASMERGDSYELGASMERGASYDLGSSLERGASYELGSSIERGASYDLESSLERGPSFEAGSSMERGSSFESDAAKGRYQSGRLSSSAEQGTSETSLGVPGSRDGVQKMGYSYEVSGSMERGDPYDQERLLGTGEFTELGGSAGGSIELSGSPGESMDIGVSMDSEEPPMPPPRVPRRGGRSPALPPSVGSGWSPTPARRKRRQKSTEVPEGGDQSMEYEEEGTEETPTLPYRRRRPGSQSSLVSSEAPLGEETTSSGWVTETTAATSTTAEFESGQAAPDSTPSLATTDTSLTARMEAVTVAAGGEAVLVVSLENIQVAKISWQKGGREIVPGPHYTTTETQKAAQLIIHGATTNDTGTYTALVTKPDGSQARAAVALQVASLSAPTKIEAPTFVRSLSDLAAKVGTRVRFLVELRQAHDVKVFWYHNNVEVVEDPRFRILHEGNFFCVDISPLTVDDEGPWRCLAENSYGQASSNASLRVIVPKGYKKPVFLEELEAILTAEGTVSLECKVVGVPTPVLRWFKDGNEIKAGDVFALTANPEDPTSLGTYTCEAVNCMGRALSSSRVRVVSRESSLRPPSRKSRRSPTPIGPPPKLVEELVDKRVKVGEKGRMLVKVETPPEVLSVTWYNNGKKIEASEKYRLSDEGGGKFMIEITPTELGDDGEWKAVVRTEGGYSSSTCKLTLTVPRNYRGPRFLDDLRAVLTEEGLVSFECKVVGYPTPVLQWFKDGQELKPGDVYQLSGTNSLGKYSCIAKNCMGEAQSSAELTIEDIKSHLNEEEKEQLLATNVPPRFIQGLKSRDIKIGDSVRLTVQVTMTPTPEITWYHEDEVVVESKNYHISKADGGLFHLDISSLDLMEQGEWKCLASNDFGHSVTAASIKLVIPRHYKKPVFLEPLRAVLSYEGTVNLECKVIGVPQPVLKWFKDGTELKPGDIHRIISGEDGTCCLGTYTCEAINVMGSASSSAALLGFEDKLLQKEGDKISLADARGIARNPSLSTINEERSSQISVYESAISEADGEKADVSVSIDGREVSLSLYETPDISEAEAKQIAEIYAEEISDHLSAHESNQAELPPLRFTRETSRKGPLIMEAMVIDVEDQAFDEYISMADVVYDDARTEADVEELSAMEAVVVEEREALCSDIADLPEMEVWGEEHVSARSVSMDAKGVAHISERQVLQHDLRTLSEQGLSFLKTHAQELPVGGREAAIAEEALVMSAGPKTMASEKVQQAIAAGSAAPGLNVAQAQEQAVFTSAGQIKDEKVEKAKGKRSIETGQVAQAEQQQFLSDADTLSDVTNISKVLERYPSFIPHEAMEGYQQETVEQAKPLDSEERPSKKVKRASVKKSQVEGQAATIQSPEVYEGEAKLPSEGGIRPERATAIPPGFEGYNVMSAEVLEDVASLEAQGMVAQHARVKDASQREALVMGQADVVSESAKSMKLKKPQSQKAEMGQVPAAGVAQQQEQSFYTATQDIPESFPAEETEADFSELHSMLEPMQSSERYAYEHAEILKSLTPEQHMAMQLDPSYREALAVSVKEGFSQAGELTLVSGQQTQAYAHQTLHEAVEGYEQIGISGDIREIPAYAQGKSDRANFMTEAAKEAVMVQEADVDYANLNVFNKEDMSHMLTVAEERSGSLAECIVVQEADLQSEAAIVSQRPAVKPERAVAGIVEGAAESATVGEPPLIAGMAGEKVDSVDKKRPASEIGEDEKKISASERKSVKIESLTDESAVKRAKVEDEAIEEMALSTTTTLTQEEIQAKKEELRAKLQNLRARKEEGLLDSPSSDSYSESLESDEARGIKVTDKTRSAAIKKDTPAAEGEQVVEEDLSGDEVECTGKSIKRRLSEKIAALKKGPSVEKTLEDGSTSPKADSSQEKTGFLKRVPSFKKGPSVEKTTSEDGAPSPTRGSSQERTGLLKRIPSFKKGPSAEKTADDGTTSPQRGASQEKTGLFSSLKRAPSSEKTFEKTSEDGTTSPKREPSQEKTGLFSRKRAPSGEKTSEDVTASPKREPSQEKTGLFSSLKRAPSSEKTFEKTSEDGAVSPKREPSQEKTGLFSRKRAPSGEKASEDGTTSPKREPSQEKTGLFSAFKRGPSAEKSIQPKQELPQEKLDLQLDTSEKPSEDGTPATKRASSQEKMGIFKKAPSAEKQVSPTKDQAQEKSISPPESPMAPKDTSEKDDVSQEKDTSEGKKKGLFAGMKSAISSKVTEMKTVISPGKSTAKSEDTEVIEGTTDSLQDLDKAQVASAEVTLQGDKDVISKDQVKATEVITVIAADSKEGLIVNGQKPSLGDSVSVTQGAAATIIEGQIAQLAEQQAKEITEGAVQGASVLDALAAKREEILARKQELLARQEAAMKGRGESEEPSSELTSTSDISSGSAGDMESVLETKKVTIAGSTVDAVGKDIAKTEEEKKLIAKTEIYEESSVTADASLSLKKKGKSEAGTETSVGLTISMKGDEESKKLIDNGISKKEIELKEAQLKEVSGTEAIEDIKIKANKVAEAKSTVVGSELHEPSVSDTEKTVFGKAKSPESKTETKAKDTKDDSKKSKSPEPKLMSKDAKKAKSPELKAAAKDKEETKTALVSGASGEAERKDTTKAKSPGPKDKMDDKKEIETKALEPKVKAEDKKDTKAKSPEPKEKMGDIKEEKTRSEPKDKLDSKTEARAKSPEAKGKLDKDESKKAKSPEPKSLDKGKEEMKTSVPAGIGAEIKDKDEKKAKSPELKDKAEDKKEAKTKSLEPKGKEEDKKDAKAKSPELKGIEKDKKDAKAKSPEQKSEVEDKKDTKAKSPEPKGKEEDKKDAKAKSPELKGIGKDKKDAKAKSPEQMSEVEDKKDTKAKSSEPKGKEEDKKDAKVQSVEDKGKLDTEKGETKRAKSAEQKDAEKGKEETKTTVSAGTAAEKIKDKEGAKEAKSLEPKTKMDDKKDTKIISSEPEGKVEDKKDTKVVSPGQKDKVEDIKDTKAKSPEAKTKADDKTDSKAMSPDSKQKLNEQKDISESKSEIKLEEDEKKAKSSETKVDTKAKKAKSPEPKAESKDAKKAKSPEPKAEDKGIAKDEITDKERGKRDLGTAKTPESKTGVGVSDVTKKDTTMKDEVSKAEEIVKDSKISKDQEVDKIKKEAETTSKQDTNKAKSPDEDKKKVTEKPDKKEGKDVPATATTVAEKAKSPDVSEKKRSDTKEDQKETKDEEKIKEKQKKAKTPDSSEKKRRSKSREKDVDSAKQVDGSAEVKEKERKSKSKSPGPKLRKRSSIKEADVKAAEEGVEKPTRLRKRSSTKEDESDVSSADKAKSPEATLRRRSSQKKDKLRSKSPEAIERKRSSLLDDKADDSLALRGAELRQQEEVLRTARRDEGKRYSQEKMMKEDEELLRLQEEEKAKRQSEMRREEIERLNREEKEIAERRKKRKEEEDKRRLEELDQMKKEEQEKAEQRKKEWEEKEKKRKEEQDREEKEEQERRKRLEIKREEIERMKKEEDAKLQKEEAERNERRKQRRLEEEKAMKEQEEKYMKQEQERRERRRKLKEDEEKQMREREEERRMKEEQEQEEKRQRKLKEREEEERLMKEEEERRKERRRKREEQDKLFAKEEAIQEEERRRRVEKDKRRLEDELRKKDEEKRQKEEELRLQGEEFLKKEEERRRRRMEERRRKDEEEEREYRRMVEESEERRRQERAKRQIEYSEKELISVERYGSIARRSLPTTPDLEANRRRDPRRRPKFSTKLQDRQIAKGTRVRLSCNVLSALDDEPPELEWFKGGYPIKEDDRIKVVNYEGVASLEINHSCKGDSGEYTCTAKNRHGRVSTTCDLRVKGDEDQRPTPPTFTTSLRERYVTEDDELVLSCHVMGFPQPKITWLKDADKLPASPRFQTSITEDGICKLIVTSPRSADSGTYTCHAENRVYRDEISANIQVQNLIDKERQREGTADDSEVPRFVSELCDQYVEENGTLTLQVEVAGSPPPDVLWLFNGRSLHPSGKFRISAAGNTHTLTVFQVTQKDIGTYSCRINNRYGHAYTLSSVYFGTPKPRKGVAVPGADMEMRAPTFKERPESMVSVYKDEEIQLSCTVVGEPTPRVTWLKGGHDVSITTRATKSVKDNHHTLVIRGASFTDSGTYTVEAKNSHGTVRAYCSVKVRETYRCRSFSPRGQDEMYVTTSYEDQQRRTTGRFIRDVPGKVGTPKAHDIGKNWVSLQWTRPEHTGGVMVTAYKVESWILGEEARWQDLGVTPIPSFDVYHLKQDREYLFRVTPRNKYGWGEAVMTPRPIRIGRKIEHPNFPRCLPHQVRAMPGGCISLDAQVTGEPMPEIRWYKDGTVIDVERYPRFSSHCSEGSMHHIFGFLCKVSLRIQDLQWEDEGKYEIEVLNPGGRVTSYTRVNTTNDCSILEAQERINNNLMALSRLDTVPSMAPQFTMRLRDRRVQVGFPVRLTCQIVGVPRPTVSWFKDGETLVIDDCHTTWQEDGHFYTLEISNSTHDDAAIYSACASNLYGSVLCKCRLIVDSGLKSYISPMFLRELEDQSVRQGETITLQTVIEAYPTIGVVWHRDGQRIRISRKHSFSLDADGIASLVIRKADYTDGGLYTCTASNEMGHIESICRVSVSCTDSDLASGRRKIPKIWYSNEPIFVRKPRAIDAEEGDLVIIECEVMGEPKPTVTWLRDWLEPSVYSDGDRFQEIGTGPVYRLEIPNCRLEDTGAYSILAKNDHGETRAVVSVQVYAKGLKGELEGTPVKRGVMEYLPVVTRPLQDVRCCDGDSVTLEALVEAPKSSIIRWEKQGKVLKLGGDIESEWDGSRVRLKIREVYPEDEGEYSCIIFNDMGKAVTSATLIVEMADDKENDVTVQMEHRPDLSRRTTPSRTNTPSRWSRSPSVNFQREGSAHSWAGVGWREPSVSVPHWRPLSRGSSPLLLARRFTPEPSTRSKSRSHRPKFYYIPHDRIVEEGETVSFQCAVKGNPVPRASWDKDNMKILEGGRIKFEERDEVRTLEIPKVTQQDAGLYRVTIENELGREQATARLDVIKSSGNKYAGYVRAWNTSPLTAPQFARRMPSTPVSEGSRLTLRADYRGSPLPRAKWYRNGELLPLCDDFPQTYNGRQAVLEVPEVTTADAGTYSCVLENDVGKTECSCEVIVEHRNEAENTPPYFIQGLKDLTVLDGDEVRLSIRVGGSLPLKVVWVRNDLEIKPSKDFRYEEEGNGSYSLFLRDVYPDDAGIYICEAYNMHGEAHSYCKMTVHDPRAAKSSAPCIVGNLTPLVVEEGSAARFTVAVHGHPAPTLSWFLDGRKLMSTPRVKVEVDEDVGPDEGHQHTLSIVHALSTDSGVLSVVASNCLGTDSASTTLKVNLYAPNREDRFKSSANSPSSVSTNVQSRLTPPRTSNSPAPRIKPMLKEISNTGTGSVDSAYGSSSLRDSSGCSSSLSNVSELEYDSITKEQHQHEMSQKLLQTVESHKEEEEEEEEEEEAEPDLDEEDEELAVGCEADSDEVGAEIISGPVDVTVLKGQSATLTASYTGKPEPLVSWLKKEQEICDGGRYSVKTENGITTLIIHDIVQEDCDKYTVVVRNSLGAHAAFASLAVGSAPEPPADKPNHSEVTDDSVTLSWYGPTYDGGSVVTGYIVEAHKIGNGDWFTLISGCHSTSYIAQGLDTNCQYEFRVRAQNIHGVSEPSKPSIPVTTSAPPDKDDEPEPEDHETAFAPLNVEIEAGANFDKQYKMHEEVGKGRFGIVYRVTDKITGTRRAAKVIKCIKSTDKEKVREEISIMNALRHPKLLQLGAAYERQKEIIMVMEYISGGELFERVVADDFALTERDCILFVRQICEGVAYMHKSHIVHLDLKPENILCVRRTSHQIKLIDFGLARRFNPDDPCRVLFGTPEFIAPEIINYELIGFSSDMWSVGVICYVLLSGLSPFMGDNDAETFANITRAEFDFDDDAFTAITEDAKDFIRSLLIKKKEKRLTAEQCFDHPWLAQTEEDMNKVVLSTDKLKKFIIRRKWQKTGNAIRALGRITHLANRRSSQPSSPTRLSPLPENQAHTPTSPSTPPPTNSPGLNSLSKTKGCPPVTRSSGSVISERSDSGISECSFSVDDNTQNPQNNQFGLTNGRAVTGRNILQSGKTPSLDWQSSVDSAVCDDDYISKSGFGSSQRKISREALLVKSAAADSMINAHSRI